MARLARLGRSLCGAALLVAMALRATVPEGDVAGAVSATGLPDQRYGIFLMGDEGNPWWAVQMGFSWVIGPGPDRPLPPGVRSLYGLPVSPIIDETTLRRLVRQRPGAAWYIENEPNVFAATEQGFDVSVDAYVRGLNYYARALKGPGGLDPSAQLLGPNVLNWAYTCTGCGGFPSGEVWTAAMRARYRARYGTEPPLDVWTIHSYDLDWEHLPQGNAGRQVAQIEGMRDWLDGIPDLRGRPIWVTEIGYLWGYPGVQRGADGRLYPTGTFAFEHLDQWMREVFGWLNANGRSLGIELWFITLSYTEALEGWMGGTRWPGIALFDGPLAAPSLNRFGRLYQQLAGIDRDERFAAGAAPPACPLGVRAC